MHSPYGAKILYWIPANFQKLLAAALIAGFTFPDFIAPAAAYSDLMVAAIIVAGFLSRPAASRIDSQQIRIACLNMAVTKVLIPIIIFFTCAWMPSDAHAAFVLIAAIPAAGVSPSITRLLGGDGELAIKLLLSESLLSCITVPLLCVAFFSTRNAIDPQDMALYFAKVLLIPLAIVTLIRKGVGIETTQRWTPWASASSVILIVALIAAIAAKIGPQLFASPSLALTLIITAVIAVPVFTTIGVVANRPRTREAAIAFGLKNMYINIGLALGLASTHFTPGVAMTMLAYVIPANLLPRQTAALSTKIFHALFRRSAS